MAMVTFNKDGRLSSRAVLKDLQSLWSDLKVAQPEKKEHTLSFQVNDTLVALAVMPAPIPWSDLEGPCATSILWPDAEQVLREHATHMIVTAMSDGPPIDRMKILTQVTAAVCGAQGASGVMWYHATLVIPPDMFREFACDFLPGELPIPLWVDFRVGAGENGATQGFTAGMSSLGHMEIETLNSPEPVGELRERFFGLCHYLLENGPVIKDGHTIGQDANERIQVAYSPSSFGHEGQVMRLEYHPTKKKRWFGR